MKLCIKCNLEKDLNLFNKDKSRQDRLHPYCRECKNKSRDKNRANEYSKQYHEKVKNSTEFKGKRKEYLKKYHQLNREKRNKQASYYAKKRKVENPEAYYKIKRDSSKKRYKERYKIDVQFKLSLLLRNRIKCAIKNNQKTGSAIRDLGCSVEELKTYLESKFQSGMTWNNWGNKKDEWSIDHINPLASFNLSNKEEFLKAIHYTNLQPLWAEDNRKKSNKT